MSKFRLVSNVLAAVAISHGCPQMSAAEDEPDATSFVSLEKLRSSGDDWRVADFNITPGAGHVRLRHDNWLMYFLHWRPLDSTNRDLSVEYVQNHLLNFWGPEMPFTLTGDTGTTTVGMHPACYAGGTIGDGAIKTRFIVWNCGETNRQFTADCNINRKMGTPEEQLQIQNKITATICCHDGCTSPRSPELPESYSSPEWNLSFAIPSAWRTHPFEAKTWFPKGMSSTNGTLWTLMTNSHKLIELRWSGHDGPVSTDRLESSLNELIIDSAAALKSPGISAFRVDTVYSASGRSCAEGTVVWLDAQDGQVFADDCTFVAELWTKGDYDFLLVAALTHMNEIWGRTIDLTPTRETMQRFVMDEVLPSIGAR